MVITDERSLGQRLQASRQAAGLTQQELCQKAHISYSTLAKIERGAIRAPSVFTIHSLAEVLETSLDGLLGHSQAPAIRLPNGRSKSGVSFVYFDINGCLVRFFHRAFTKIAEDTGQPADMIETTFWHYNDAVCRGEMPMEEFNNVVAAQLKVPTIDWNKYYLDSVDPIPEMHDLVRWASENYRIGLLSNIMPGLISEMMSRKLLPSLPYASIIDSSQVGAIKPEKQIYEIAQQRAGVPGSEILLIDDARTNLMAAEHFGWHVLWFDDFRPDESVSRVRQSLELA